MSPALAAVRTKAIYNVCYTPAKEPLLCMAAAAAAGRSDDEDGGAAALPGESSSRTFVYYLLA